MIRMIDRNPDAAGEPGREKSADSGRGDAASRTKPEKYVTNLPEYYCEKCDTVTVVTDGIRAKAIAENRKLVQLTGSEMSARKGLEALGECCPRPDLSPLGKGIELSDTDDDRPDSGGK